MNCAKCNDTGKIEVHKPGMTHYETDAGEPCPAYHCESKPCPHCDEVERRIAEAVEAEREACAKISEDYYVSNVTLILGGSAIAAAIRARGKS